MSQFYNDAIFWVDVDKIVPNPYQPRKEFDQIALQALSDSIKQYGVLQALVVTRKDVYKDDGGIGVEYELIAGERRLRASKLAGLKQVPVLIRAGEENDLLKLELAIIENVQREDLNPVERAKAFKRLIDEFGFKHHTVGEKIGKSRVYVTNTLRILDLPEEMVQALSEGKIFEGHTRPLLMLTTRPEEQKTLFKEIIYKKLNVREAEMIARKIAVERARKITHDNDPTILELEEKFTESLGTRVSIEKRQEGGGKLSIDFFSYDDLRNILEMVQNDEKKDRNEILNKHIASLAEATPLEVAPEQKIEGIDDRAPQEIKKDDNTEIPDAAKILPSEDEDLYSVKNFTV